MNVLEGISHITQVASIIGAILRLDNIFAGFTYKGNFMAIDFKREALVRKNSMQGSQIDFAASEISVSGNKVLAESFEAVRKFMNAVILVASGDADYIKVGDLVEVKKSEEGAQVIIHDIRRLINSQEVGISNLGEVGAACGESNKK